MNGKNKAWVRSRALCIHVSVPYGSILISYFHTVVDFRLFNNTLLSHVLYKNSSLFIFSYFEICFWPVKQILNLFHVDLDHWDFDCKFKCRICLANLFKDIWYHPRYDTSTFLVHDICTSHSVRFATRCLSISKYCTIESFHYTLNNPFDWFFKNFTLTGKMIKNSIVCVFNHAWTSIRIYSCYF